jgi:ubiquinone/menaquinone biosynthesis C-methylase UbiE
MQEDDLIGHLICPDCRKKIEKAGRNRLVCAGCKRIFILDNNAIQMLPAARKGSREDDAWKKLPYEGIGKPAWMALLHKKDRVLYFYEKILPKIDFTGKLLEIGAGTCWASALIKKRRPESLVVATDISPYALEKGLSVTRLLDSGVDYRIACDAERLPFSEEYFDFVLSNATIHHFSDPQKGVNEMKRVLKKGGKCCALGEVAAAPPFRAVLTSRIGTAGRRARSFGIQEKVYTLQRWQQLFRNSGFKNITVEFDKSWEYKLYDWSTALYYRLLSSVPDFLLGAFLPCNVNIYALKQ